MQGQGLNGVLAQNGRLPQNPTTSPPTKVLNFVSNKVLNFATLKIPKTHPLKIPENPKTLPIEFLQSRIPKNIASLIILKLVSHKIHKSRRPKNPNKILAKNPKILQYYIRQKSYNAPSHNILQNWPPQNLKRLPPTKSLKQILQ